MFSSLQPGLRRDNSAAIWLCSLKKSVCITVSCGCSVSLMSPAFSILDLTILFKKDYKLMYRNTSYVTRTSLAVFRPSDIRLGIQRNNWPSIKSSRTQSSLMEITQFRHCFCIATVAGTIKPITFKITLQTRSS
jgi:hypothetical protein